MTGSASYARCAGAAAVARERLDRAAAVAGAMESGQRWMIAALLELWPTSAWIAAGASSAKAWLLAYTGVSDREALRLDGSQACVIRTTSWPRWCCRVGCRCAGPRSSPSR